MGERPKGWKERRRKERGGEGETDKQEKEGHPCWGVGSKAGSNCKSMGKADLMEMVVSEQRLAGVLVVEDLAVNKTQTSF